MKQICIFIVLAGLIVTGAFLLPIGSNGNEATSKLQTQEELAAGVESSTTTESGHQRPVVSETGPWPKATVDSDRFDFGRMELGKSMSHVFHIRNTGDAVLEMMTGEPTCKCTKFVLNKSSLLPGEQAELLITWKGAVRDKSFMHGGPVYTNDPQNEMISFAVSGIVDTAINLQPGNPWYVGEISSDTPAAITAKVLSPILDEFEITSITSSSEFISWEITPVSPRELLEEDAISGYTVALSVSPDAPPGLFDEVLKINVDSQEHPIDVAVKGRRIGVIRVLGSPGVNWNADNNGLTLGQFSTSKGRTVKLFLLVDEEGMSEPFAITSFETSPSFLQTELQPLGSTTGSIARYALTITYPPGAPKLTRNRSNPGTIRCITNHPTGEVLDIKLAFKAF